MSLFQPIPNAAAADATRPLADRMRPRTLDEYVGQEHLIGPGKPLRVQIERDDSGSLIFWGPPGTGKTTLAKIIANMTKAEFIEFSAVLAGIKEIKQVMADAERARQYGTRTIVFIDEIHRFNKAQQDAFLAARGEGQYSPDRCNDRESILRNQLGAALTLPRLRPAAAYRRADRAAATTSALPIKSAGLGEMNLTASDDVLRISQATPAATPAAPTTCWKLRPGWRTRMREGARRDHRRDRPRCAAETHPALRQIRRRALQPDLSAAQIRAQQRS